MANVFPSRIVCLSAESAEILCRLGCANRIAGVTGFASGQGLRGKPRVSGFSSVNYQKIDSLRPDLIITFSDVQADATCELIRRGHTVLATNQRSLEEVFATIRLVGRAVGLEAKGRDLANAMRSEISSVANKSRMGHRPKIYFEEWNGPLISGIRWVSELIEAAGGSDIFAELRDCPRAADRVVQSEEVIRRQPDIIVASWCGKKIDVNSICARRGWDRIPAICNGRVYEIDSADILQPGPGLLRGFRQLRDFIFPATERLASRKGRKGR